MGLQEGAPQDIVVVRYVMKVKNKKFRSWLFAGLAIQMGLLGLLSTGRVFADINPFTPEPGVLCNTPSLLKVINSSVTAERTACESEGGTIIETGQTLPFPICVLLKNSSVFEVIDDNFRNVCNQPNNGVVIEAGQPSPALTIGATFTPPPVVNTGGGGGGSSCSASSTTGTCDPNADCTAGTDPSNCGITRYLKIFINVLSGMVGVVVVGVLVLGGIQYATSAGDPNAAAAARKRVNNGLLALVAFGLMYGFLQWLVPGGVL